MPEYRRRMPGLALDAASRPLLRRLAWAAGAVRRTGLLMCGIPDYERYVAHLRERHPERPIPSYEAFFRERLEARYGRNGSARCC